MCRLLGVGKSTRPGQPIVGRHIASAAVRGVDYAGWLGMLPCGNGIDLRSFPRGPSTLSWLCVCALAPLSIVCALHVHALLAPHPHKPQGAPAAALLLCVCYIKASWPWPTQSKTHLLFCLLLEAETASCSALHLPLAQSLHLCEYFLLPG